MWNTRMLMMLVLMMTTIMSMSNGEYLRMLTDLSDFSGFENITQMLPQSVMTCVSNNAACVMSLIEGTEIPSKSCIQSLSECLLGDCITNIGAYGSFAQCEMSMIPDLIANSNNQSLDGLIFDATEQSCSSSLSQTPILTCLVTLDSSAFTKASIVSTVTNIFNMIQADQCGALSELVAALSTGSLELPFPMNFTSNMSLSEEFDAMMEQVDALPETVFDFAAAIVDQINSCADIVPEYFANANEYINANNENSIDINTSSSLPIASIFAILAIFILGA